MVTLGHFFGPMPVIHLCQGAKPLLPGLGEMQTLVGDRSQHHDEVLMIVRDGVAGINLDRDGTVGTVLRQLAEAVAIHRAGDLAVGELEKDALIPEQRLQALTQLPVVLNEEHDRFPDLHADLQDLGGDLRIRLALVGRVLAQNGQFRSRRRCLQRVRSTHPQGNALAGLGIRTHQERPAAADGHMINAWSVPLGAAQRHGDDN
jgi:hypothetical protein